jgi:hypothetical protein
MLFSKFLLLVLSYKRILNTHLTQHALQVKMQQTVLFQSLIFLWLLALGQATPIDESKRADILCCTFGLDYSTSADTCFEWNNCDGGYTACTSNSEEGAICSQCLADPLKAYCKNPITQSKRDLDSGNAILVGETTP